MAEVMNTLRLDYAAWPSDQPLPSFDDIRWQVLELVGDRTLELGHHIDGLGRKVTLRGEADDEPGAEPVPASEGGGA